MTRKEFEDVFGHEVSDDAILAMQIECSYQDFVDFVKAINSTADPFLMYQFVGMFDK